MATTEAPITKQEDKPVVPAVVEEPKPTEQQVTEAYLEKRAKGEAENLPVPEPTIKPAETTTEQQTTDAYLAERQERKRKARGGIRATIDELTKEKAELAKEKAEAEARAKAAEDAKAALEAKPKEEPKPAEPTKVESKAKPKMNEFTDIDEYHAAMALWAADERARANGGVIAAKEPDQAVQIAKIRKEEFDNFLEKGRRFIAGHPDFNETLDAAHIRGLTMSEAARTAITRLAVPEVAYWLAKPENDLAARKLMDMDDMQQVVEVGRIAERLAPRASDFVSSAPQPGIRLSGADHVHELPLDQITDTDDYIRRRQLEKAARRRGR